MATVTVTWTVPDAQVQPMKDDFCAALSYNSETDGTQNAFLKKKLGEYVLESVKNYRSKVQAETARSASLASTEANLTFT